MLYVACHQILLLLMRKIFTVQFYHALGAYPVGECRFGVIGDIGLDLLPVTIVIPDFLA